MLSRWVTFKGTVYGPLGQGTGTSAGPATAFGWRFDSGLAIGLVVISPALYFVGRRFREKGKSCDLTKIIYPIIITLTGWYTVAIIYRIVAVPSWDPLMSVVPYTIIWSSIPIAFSYAAIRKVKLEFKWSVLSVIGMVIVAYFLVAAISELLNPDIPKYNFFFTGIWDHTFFPMAFGLLVLCDLNRMHKTFWVILLPISLICLIPTVNIISALLFDISVVPIGPGISFYFGVESMAQIPELPQDVLMNSLILGLREELGFMILIPASVLYYLFKGIFKRPLQAH